MHLQVLCCSVEVGGGRHMRELVSACRRLCALKLAGRGAARCRVVPGLSLPTPLLYCSIAIDTGRSTRRRSHRRFKGSGREATNRNLGQWVMPLSATCVSCKLRGLMFVDIGPNSIGARCIDVHGQGRRGEMRVLKAQSRSCGR